MLARQLDAYLDHLTVERGAAPNTLASYRRDLTRYLEHLTDLGIDDLAEVREDRVDPLGLQLRRRAQRVLDPLPGHEPRDRPPHERRLRRVIPQPGVRGSREQHFPHHRHE